MKKFLLSMITLAAMATSCDLSNKESFRTDRYGDSNLIIDMADDNAPALVSSGAYDLKYIYDRNVMSITSDEVIINNQKYSFESDEMEAVASGNRTLFSKQGNAGNGVKNINGAVAYSYALSYVSANGSTVTLSLEPRLLMSYEIADRYLVKTFTSQQFYKGETYVHGESDSFFTKTPGYRVGIDFSKNMATVIIYNPELTYADTEEGNKNKTVNLIQIEEIPVKFNHDSYYLSADAPKTKILDSENKLVESSAYKVTSFSMQITGSDLTGATISYRLDGKDFNFDGKSTYTADNSQN